uniref:Gag-Pol polyprotein n=1 Tax=Lygus hesperus TaxID=30085 RepID=A0A0A9Z3M8_LYGHE
MATDGMNRGRTMSTINGDKKATGILEEVMSRLESLVSLTVKQYVEIGKLSLTKIPTRESYKDYHAPELLGLETNSVVAILAEALSLAIQIEVQGVEKLMNESKRSSPIGESVSGPLNGHWMSHWSPRKWKVDRRKNVICWECSRIGHISKGCPVRNKARSVKRWRTVQDIVCWNCGASGHRQWSCKRSAGVTMVKTPSPEVERRMPVSEDSSTVLSLAGVMEQEQNQGCEESTTGTTNEIRGKTTGREQRRTRKQKEEQRKAKDTEDKGQHERQMKEKGEAKQWKKAQETDKKKEETGNCSTVEGQREEVIEENVGKVEQVPNRPDFALGKAEPSSQPTRTSIAPEVALGKTKPSNLRNRSLSSWHPRMTEETGFINNLEIMNTRLYKHMMGRQKWENNAGEKSTDPEKWREAWRLQDQINWRKLDDRNKKD